jgi:hypothetical protein
MMKLYIAGPMTGRAHFNFPAFDCAVASLEYQGFECVSPADLDEYGTRLEAINSPDGAPGSGGAGDATWGDFLSRDVKVIADVVDGVALMPEWETSKGARLEAFICRHVGKPVFYITDYYHDPQFTGRDDWPDDVDLFDSQDASWIELWTFDLSDPEQDLPNLVELDDAELDRVLTQAKLDVLAKIAYDEKFDNPDADGTYPNRALNYGGSV